MYKKLIAITNRTLCSSDYFEQIARIASVHPRAMILREKDLSEAEYEEYARQVQSICEEYGVPLFIHTYDEVALRLACRRIHLSISALQKRKDVLNQFDEISVSCHSEEDVAIALEAGATQIILGTIFETECKKGLKGRGLEFVAEVTKKCPVPIYAIGGIKETNIDSVVAAGAAGGCMMSGFMRMS